MTRRVADRGASRRPPRGGPKRLPYPIVVADDSQDGPFAEPVVVAIEESIDLHSFHPSETLDVVDAYLDAAIEAGFVEVRLIHGRGRGVQRERVRSFLSKDSRVERWAEAPAGRGGWGATLAWLRAAISPPKGRNDLGC